MSLLMQLLETLQSKIQEDEPERSMLQATHPLIQQIRRLATQEGRDENELTLEILQRGIAGKRAYNRSVRSFHKLTGREKEVAAYICWGASNEEIAEKLVISKGTVRAHVGRILIKFEVEHRSQVRDMLNWWDVTEWVS